MKQLNASITFRWVRTKKEVFSLSMHWSGVFFSLTQRYLVRTSISYDVITWRHIPTSQSTLTVQPPQEGTVIWSIDIFVIASCIIDLVTPDETLWRTSNVFFWTRLVDDAIFNDGIIKWKHIRHSWSFVQGIHRSPVNSQHKFQWRGALMFSLICARINPRENNLEAGDLRRHRAHYDANVMPWILSDV